MDSVVLDGVEYIKASVLAKRFRYTSDYVGQLCRNKKVDARLVGRTWFVNPSSVEGHKKNKYSNTSSVKVSEPETGNEIKPVRIDVFPSVRAKTLKQISLAKVNDAVPQKRKLKISYEVDDGFLIPELTKKHYQPAKSVRIDQVDAVSVKIDGKTEDSSFSPTPIPEVALSGKLVVSEVLENTETDNVSNNISNEPVVVKNVTVPNDARKSLKKKLTLFKRKASMVNIVPRTIPHKSPISDPVTQSRFPSKVKIDTNANKANNQVKKIDTVTNNKAVVIAEPVIDKKMVLKPALDTVLQKAVSNPPPKQKMSLLVQISPLIATILAFILILIILSTNTTLISNGVVYNAMLSFKLENLIKLIAF